MSPTVAARRAPWASPGSAPAHRTFALGLLVSVALAAGTVVLGYETTPAVAAWPVLVGGVVLVVRRPDLGLYAGILAVPLESAQLPIGAGQLTPAKGLLLLTAIVLAARWLRHGPVKALHPSHASIGLLVAIALLSVTVARDSGQALKICLAALAYLVLSIYVAAQGRPELERILRCAVLSAGVTGLVAALSTGTQQLIGDVATGRAQGGFAQPNVLAAFLLLCIPPGLALSFSGARAWRWWLRLATAAATAGLVLSLSRAGIIGAVIALGVLAAWPPLRRTLIALMLVAIALLVFVPSLTTSSTQISVVTQRLGTLTSGGGNVGGDRGALRAAAPRIIADHPVLGVGEGNFPDYSLEYGLFDVEGLPFDHPHNLLLTIGAELGLGGLVILLWFLGVTARSAWRAARYDRRRRHWDPLALSLAGVFLGLFAESMGDYPIRTDVVFAVVMIEIGAVVALERHRRDANRNDRRRPDPSPAADPFSAARPAVSVESRPAARPLSPRPGRA